jgi:hypothetical protein
MGDVQHGEPLTPVRLWAPARAVSRVESSARRVPLLNRRDREGVLWPLRMPQTRDSRVGDSFADTEVAQGEGSSGSSGAAG